MQDTFLGFLKLRLLAFIPLVIVILVLVGVSALTGGSTALGIAVLAFAAVVVVAALSRLMARRGR